MEQWKDAVLKSMQGAKRAEPDPGLFTAIQARIKDVGQFKVVKTPYVAVAAACLGLLIMANVRLLSGRNTETDASSVYQIEVANFSLYQ